MFILKRFALQSDLFVCSHGRTGPYGPVLRTTRPDRPAAAWPCLLCARNSRSRATPAGHAAAKQTANLKISSIRPVCSQRSTLDTRKGKEPNRKVRKAERPPPLMRRACAGQLQRSVWPRAQTKRPVLPSKLRFAGLVAPAGSPHPIPSRTRP